MEKIKNIEFLRIIGCIAIILLHLYNEAGLLGVFGDIELYHKFRVMTCNGQKAVDLFFIISGFFFAYKLNLKYDLLGFIKNKILRLYPVLIFVIVLSGIISLFGIIPWNFYDNILSLLCLTGTSLVSNLGLVHVGVFWYVSALLWVTGFYYFLLKNYPEKNVKLLIALLAFFSYSFLIHAKGGKINHHTQTFYYIFNVGLMRAMGGIGIGYFIGDWYKNNIQKITTLKFNLPQKLITTVIEFCCLFFIINNLMLRKLHYHNDLIYIIVFSIIIILFLIKQGYISKILDNNIPVFLASFTYSIYMTHRFVMNVIKGSFWKYNPEIIYSHPIINILITIVIVLIFGVLTYYFIEKPCARFLHKSKN